MKELFRIYKILNLLSIDVAAGAVIGCRFFAEVMHIEVYTSGLVALGLTVWVIYTVDHLLDAERIPAPAVTERHRFHQQHRAYLVMVLFLVVAADLYAILHIRPAVLMGGMKLMGLVTLYFLMERRLKFLKEITVALLYSAGVLLVPLSLNHGMPALSVTLLIAQYGVTALANLLLFSLMDLIHDLHNHQHSFTTSLGVQITRKTLGLLLMISTGLLLAQLFLDTPEKGPAMVIALMNLVLWCIYLKRDFFMVNARYRVFGDAIFFLPLLIS